jgi:threonyl-tRNA synthetase
MIDIAALRHSAAHVLAEAVGSLFPGTLLHIGPATDSGFFYDVLLPDGRALASDDLPRIEQEMARIAERDTPFVRRVRSRDAALALFGDLGQKYKVERIAKLAPEAEISIFEQGGFVDLCRGPHVERTGLVAHVKLTQVSGAYLDGDAGKQQLQRIHGVVFPTREELEAWVRLQEEAARRDHRVLGQQLELFMVSDLSPGAVFWLPNGESLYDTLKTGMRSLLLDEGYVAVNTPLVIDHKLWATSGHLEHYHKAMFHVVSGDEARDRLAPSRGLKPMNCPCHMLVFGAKRRSYRELPMRIHDQGVLHRNELSGALGGLTRVRQFCQDDAHIFCTREQIQAEVLAMIGLIQRVYGALGLGYSAKLSTRPAERLGEEALWDLAEGALQSALIEARLDYVVKAGDGAFYGPKIDFDVKDALGRDFQCATIQLDFQLPRRFELSFVGPDGNNDVPVVIHRAIFGSFERFIGILIEHFAGEFPAWLAPEVVRVATISDRSAEYGRRLLEQLRRGGIRATLDDSREKIGRKVRAWREARGPYLAIVGEKESAAGSVVLRSRDGSEVTLGVADLAARLARESKVPFLSKPASEVVS